MKKTLIAIAALAATGAFAQSSVTIDGLVDVGYVSVNYRGKSVNGITNNGSGTTQLNFRGVSDVGGGMKADFRFESDFNPANFSGANTGTGAQTAAPAGATGTASTFGNGENKVGLKAGFGYVQLGAANNLGLTQHGMAQPFGTAIGSGFRATSTSDASSYAAANVRYDNALRYDSPVLFGGLTLTYQGRGAQNNAGTTSYYNAFGVQQQAAVRDLGATYAAGPLTAILLTSTLDNTTNPANTISKLTAGAVAYNMGATTLSAGFQQGKINTAGADTAQTSQFNVAGKYVMGVNTFMAQYAKLNSKLNDKKATTLGLGYNYALSKSVDLTARYERVADDIGTTIPTGAAAVLAGGTDGNARTRLGLGMQMRF